MFEVLGVVHVVVDYLIIWGVDHIIVVGYIVDHYCFKCVWGVVHFVMLVILLNIPAWWLPEE